MQFLAIALPLALAGGAFANPLAVRGAPAADACLAAVTGKAALGDDKLRADHCKSFLATTVTPAAKTTTVTVVATGSAEWEAWKRDTVTLCPNEVPNYASACNSAGYKSACSVFGYTYETTVTIAPTTTTKTVYVKPTGAATGSCAPSTVTVTVSGTAGSTGKPTPSPKCLAQKDVDYFVTSFTDFLENTGTDFNVPLAQKILASNFTDISDSINFMANFTLGSVTFPSPGAFIGGQSAQPEVKVTSLNTWYSCRTITWRYRLTPLLPVSLPVVGINVFEISEDLTQLVRNFAEFDNGAWLQSYKASAALSAGARKL